MNGLIAFYPRMRLAIIVAIAGLGMLAAFLVSAPAVAAGCGNFGGAHICERTISYTFARCCGDGRGEFRRYVEQYYCDTGEACDYYTTLSCVPYSPCASSASLLNDYDQPLTYGGGMDVVPEIGTCTPPSNAAYVSLLDFDLLPT